MRRSAAAPARLIAASFLLTGCGPLPPVDGPDRAEVVRVPGGTCDISWWLGPAVDEPSAEASRVAVDALEEASVSDSQWASWYQLVDDDPDLPSLSQIRKHGSAYSEAVREDVRSALESAGYPDIERVIEVYSDISCERMIG